MSSSLFAAMARMSRFCSFVSFLIGSPFMRLSSSGRNDTDDFFALFLIESMDDQQNRAGAYGSNLIFRSEVALGQSIGIIENEHGRLKANIVLAKVLPVFLFIPLKSHNLVATTR